MSTPHNIDALAAAADIKTTYRRYLRSLLSVREPKLNAALHEAIESSDLLDKGPYLEATPPYAPGATVRELIEAGVLSPEFSGLGSQALPLDRPLYVHQDRSIRKVAAGRNVVVATGTGSGKTESFLLPILDSIVREKAAGTLGPGVRALLLYPMNALANDQLKRLRQLLAGYPDITFGRYTGDTEEKPKEARELFAQLNAGEPMLPNELLSREEMKASPPHLLLTNYAMLEYLLLRPDDMVLFPEGSDTWKFIAVDEAHVYDGTQGAEIAMLLRRVRDRVAPNRRIQCIATSATVGADSDPAAVTQFATNLFGERFEWVNSEPDRQDLITAQRIAARDGAAWGPLSGSEYEALASALDREQAVVAAAAAAGFSAASAHDALLAEKSLNSLKKELVAAPLPFDQAATSVFGTNGAAGLASMVELASGTKAPDGSPALSARYHLFLRATEGAFVCLAKDEPHVRLARHDQCPECESAMFEVGSCRRCGAVHLVGSAVASSGTTQLKPRRATGGNVWLLLGDVTDIDDEDEAAAVDDVSSVSADEARLCVGCGSILAATAAGCPGCSATVLRPVRRLKQRGDEIAGCLQCGARGAATVRLFESGADASGAVIATSLYQALPPAADQFGQLPGDGRKLLAFSDSRQAAAYFAPYFEGSYDRLKTRRLIAQGLEAGRGEPATVDDLVFNTRRAAEAVRTFPRRMTGQQQSREVAPWVMAEMVATDDRISLEGLGLTAVEMDQDPAWTPPAPLLAMGLSAQEAWAFLQELVRTLRQQGAVTMPHEVNARDEIFEPRLGPIFVRQSGPEAVRKVLSWLPGKGTNRRVDYVEKVLRSLGRNDDAVALLKGIWQYLTYEHRQVDWLRAEPQPGLGVVYQVDHELLRVSHVTDDRPAYQCSTCRRMASSSVRGICPALRCDGVLEPFVPPALGDEQDHYRSAYRSMLPVPVKALEHTAQWTNVEAANVQHQFVRGEVNALSCSTTFELGVDVGELQAVFLRNMPPSTANYVQRAGRAGRRAGAAALVVTYANRRSHDLARFAQPESMMAGTVRAPYVPLENSRIDRRHAHSVVMSEFFRHLVDLYGTSPKSAGGFFLPGEDGTDAPVTLVAKFLDPVPARIRESLLRVLPADVAKDLDVAGDGWVEPLLGLLENVRLEMTSDVGQLESLQLEAAEAKRYQLADRYRAVSKTLEMRNLLGFLATRNVLPKYGFPVDTVELRTAFSGDRAGARIELSRDLSQAIYEYAPDATLVAGGLLWTARGIYKMPGRELDEFQYRVCSRCDGFWHDRIEVDANCPHCGEVAQRAARTVAVPEFGFVAARNPDRPGPRPPKRSWSGATYVLRDPDETESTVRTVTLSHGEAKVTAGPRGRLVVVADGPGSSGFWVCSWCGSGAARMTNPTKPPKHDHLISGKPCNGSSRALDLAHTYETDLMKLDIKLPGAPTSVNAWKSLLYAILAAASDELEIARSDIGGSLQPTGATSWSIVLHDAVPGGAGHVMLIAKHLERVLTQALARVSFCDCGSETSCYGCLRGYENQRDHDVLSRGAAAALLVQMV